MLYSHVRILSEMAQESLTKHSVCKCNYDLYDKIHEFMVPKVEELK